MSSLALSGNGLVHSICPIWGQTGHAQLPVLKNFVGKGCDRRYLFFRGVAGGRGRRAASRTSDVVAFKRFIDDLQPLWDM